MPKLLVYAGPNGSGKTTAKRGWKAVGQYINADDIKRVLNCSSLEAAQQAEGLRELMLAKGESFTFETVLSTERNYSLMERAKAAGYCVECIFCLTCDPMINVERVRQRVLAGGHDVPEDKIVSRYGKSLGMVPKLALLCDHLLVIDNSEDGPMAKTIIEVLENKVSIFETTDWPQPRIMSLLNAARAF